MLSDGSVWINSDGEVRVITTDASSVDALTGALDRVVRSPSECADSSSMFDAAAGDVFLAHDRSFRCSCEWSEEAPCPFYLRVRQEDEIIKEVFVSGNSDVPLGEVEVVRAGAAVARASFDPAYPEADAARKACTPLENVDAITGRYWYDRKPEAVPSTIHMHGVSLTWYSIVSFHTLQHRIQGKLQLPSEVSYVCRSRCGRRCCHQLR